MIGTTMAVVSRRTNESLRGPANACLKLMILESNSFDTCFSNTGPADATTVANEAAPNLTPSGTGTRLVNDLV